MHQNGKQPHQFQVPAFMKFPHVIVFADPASATPENPNGVQIMSNVKVDPINPTDANMTIFEILAEGSQQWAKHLRAKAKGKYSSALITPDGKLAQIPEGTTDEPAKADVQSATTGDAPVVENADVR